MKPQLRDPETGADLAYHGRVLTAEPTNLSLAHVAGALANHEPVRVVLEPGDATRYELILVPRWARYVGGVEPYDAEYLLAVYLNERRAQYVTQYTSDLTELVDHNRRSATWTSIFLLAWFQALWEAITYQRRVRALAHAEG